MAYSVELTDTFGGEANYSWVRRATVKGPDAIPQTVEQRRAQQALIMRRAKAAVGIAGYRGKVSDYGDGYEFRPYGWCAVLFVQWSDEGEVI